MEVGIRELKAKLSEYVNRVSAGETVVVTDRGTPVARLVGLDDDGGLRRGIAEGWVDAPRRNALGTVDRQRATESVMRTLDDDRGR